MPAPKIPNTGAATVASVAKRTRAKHDRWAAEMREAGWAVGAPDSDTRTDEHRFQVEILFAGTWIPDLGDLGDTPRWYTLVGSELRIQALERRGTKARLCQPA